MGVAIPLTLGMVAIVDETDAAAVQQYKWHASKTSDGHYYARGYVQQGGEWVKVYMHRHLTGAAKGVDVDHKNGDTLDNSRSNLRVCSHAENMQNVQARVSNGRTKGVSFDRTRNKYQAYINVNGKRISLGRFATEDEAIAAHNAAALVHHGEFAALNG